MSVQEEFAAELGKHFAGEIRLDLASRVLYSTDASIYQIEPLGVVLPRNQEDLQAAVELAAKYHVPILPRGGGSSLAGQAIGEAMILDCSRWLDQIVRLDPESKTAEVEPGVILTTLNRRAAAYNLQYGPDPSSGERATMGGVVANNATGAHSIMFGMAADHLLSADVIMADGTSAHWGMIRDAEAGGDRRQHTRYAEVLQAARAIRSGYADAIKARTPRTWRNSAGYRLNYLLPWSPSTPPEWQREAYPAGLKPGELNLAHLLAGSEGTLAVIRRMTVNLVPRPSRTILGILIFPTIEAACEAVPELLTHHPSAVELVPSMLLKLAQHIPAFAHALDWLGTTSAELIAVEFSGESAAALRRSAEDLGPGAIIAESSEQQNSLWAVRKVGLGILDSRPQAARPIAFIEDCAIPVENLGRFVREIQRILHEHGTEGGIYGHASAGCLHIKPILNLQTAKGVRSLRDIAEQTLRLSRELGGSMVSEHGDGIARGEWLMQTYGAEVAAAMRELKRAADPDGLLSPGKLLDAPPMDTHLRYGVDYRSRAWVPGTDFAREGGLATAIEQCNGQGVCRKDAGVMCPSFQATREEKHSTRGRANLLRAMIHVGASAMPASTARGNSDADPKALEKSVFEALDLCLACKGCTAECPSGVDMPKLKSAFQEKYFRNHRRPLRDYVFGYFHVTARLLSAIAPAANLATGIPLFRRALSAVLQITDERPFPRFRGGHVRTRSGAGTPILFLRDAFTHYVETEVEQAAFDLLGEAGFYVRVLQTMGAGAALHTKGFLKAARQHAQRLAAEMARLDRQAALTLVAIEPSELSALRNDYRDILPGLETKRLEQFSRAMSVGEVLAGTDLASRLHFGGGTRHVLFHPHCHEKADQGAGDGQRGGDFAGLRLLRAAGCEVELVDAGCCGMAGTFGYEAEHYALSQQVGALRLFPSIRAAGDAAIAATGAACRMQIRQGTGRTAEHPLVILARGLPRR